MLVHVLIPMRDLYLLLPWSALLVFVVTFGWYCGGWQVAGIQALFALYLAFAGFWERTLITAYMVSFAVIVCVTFGSLVGIWAAAGPRRTKVVELILDTFQTFPSFIYLYLPDPGDHAVQRERFRVATQFDFRRRTKPGSLSEAPFLSPRTAAGRSVGPGPTAKIVRVASGYRIKSTGVRLKMLDRLHDIDSIRFLTFSGVLDTNGDQCHAASE